MNIQELERKLNEAGIPKDAYSLGIGGLPSERYCLVMNGNAWEFYYSERGRKSALKYFDDESVACEYFWNELRSEFT